MKKLSFVLLTIGIIMISLPLLFINKNDDSYNIIDNNLSLDFKKVYGEYFNKDILKYDNVKLINKMFNGKISVDNNIYYYVIPNNLKITKINSTNITYSDDELDVFQYFNPIGLFDEYYNNLIGMYSYYNNYTVLRYDVDDNLFAILLKCADENSYNEYLEIFIKENNSYYNIKYYLKNKSFSNELLKLIINGIKKEKTTEDRFIKCHDNMCSLSFDDNIFLKLNINLDKYVEVFDSINILNKISFCKMSNDNTKVDAKIDIYLYYDKDNFFDIYGQYGDLASSKVSINNYEFEKYQYIKGQTYSDYIIKLNNKAILFKISSNSIDGFDDIMSDFTNFIY